VHWSSQVSICPCTLVHDKPFHRRSQEENKEIALGTSKLNYLDPRISVAWCKKWEVPVEKIYNKSQRDKFAWAIDMAGEDFVFWQRDYSQMLLQDLLIGDCFFRVVLYNLLYLLYLLPEVSLNKYCWIKLFLWYIHTCSYNNCCKSFGLSLLSTVEMSVWKGLTIAQPQIQVVYSAHAHSKKRYIASCPCRTHLDGAAQHETGYRQVLDVLKLHTSFGCYELCLLGYL